jgi:hypothetical protein
MELSRDQFEYWASLPETKVIKAFMQERLEDCKSSLVNGSTLGENCDQKTAEMVGIIRGLSMFTGLEYV